MARNATECENHHMPRKRDKKARRGEATPQTAKGFANQPFGALRRLPAAAVVQPAPVAPPMKSKAVEEEPPAEDLFSNAMRDVRPLDERQRAVVPPPARQTRRRPIEHADVEVLAALSDLVAGEGVFDITDTTEFLEGAVAGVDRRLVRRLRRGDFAFRRHLDLHGMTVDEARTAVAAFLQGAMRDGERCVLIVHGRGLNSPDHVPVLKRNLMIWLSRGAWARSVLAFASARPCDGGAGALYVLLRRRRDSKKQVHVTEGAKW